MTSIASNVRTWGEMIKFSHSVFALPFAVLGAFLAARAGIPAAGHGTAAGELGTAVAEVGKATAELGTAAGELGTAPALGTVPSGNGMPTVGQFALIIVCMVGARSAAMTFNRIIDARMDAQNPRTAGRALPSGKISREAAWGFFAAAAGLFGAGCAGFGWAYGNWWPAMLALPVLAALCAYSYMKYVTRWSHVVLGAAIAMSPVAAWVAVNPASLGWHSWLLMGAVMFWIGGFDVIYACQDVEFDRRAGLHSVPAKFGVATALWLARGFHALTVALLIGVGVTNGLGRLYYAGVACVAVLLAVENAIVSPRDLSRVNVAFFTVNGVVGVVLGVLGVLDIVLN